MLRERRRDCINSKSKVVARHWSLATCTSVDDFYSWLVNWVVLIRVHFYWLPSSGREMTLVSTTSVWETNF
jgi:hypothetical protein